MRIAGLVALVVLAAGLFFLGRGMQINPEPIDQYVGIGVHFVAVGLIFSLLHWRRLGLPEPRQTQTRLLAGALITFGVIGTGASYFLASFLFVLWLGHSSILVWLGLNFCLIAVGAGLWAKVNWARPVTKLLAFPLSLSWPIGLLVAIYAWWVLSPSRTPAANGAPLG